MLDYLKKSPRKSSNLQMLYQFRDTLQANLLSVPADVTSMSPTLAALRKKMQEVLDAPDFTWAAAYQAEKILAHIRPKESLEIEITKQISALAKVDQPAAALFTKELEKLTDAAASADLTSPQDDTDTTAGKAAAEAAAAAPAPAPKKPKNKEEPEKEDPSETPPAQAPPKKETDPKTASAGKSNSQAQIGERTSTLALRHLLERVLNDVHWKYSQRYFNRLIVDRFSIFVFITGALLALLFFGTLFATGVIEKDSPMFMDWSFAGFFLAVVAGLLGASFSVLNRDRAQLEGSSIEETLLQTGLPNVYLRIGIGGISAAILYFFFNAGLLDGLLFPNLEALGFATLSEVSPPKVDVAEAFKVIAAMEVDSNSPLKSLVADAGNSNVSPQLIETVTKAISETQPNQPNPLGTLVPNADLSKLLVWSFIAGFFQQFVPNALNRAKDATDKPGADKPDAGGA